jgi:hypothetical protein
MYQNLLSKFIHFFVVFFAVLLIVLIFNSQSVARDNDKSNKIGSKLPPNFLWCGTSDNNTYIDFCFSTQKVCKNFALKRREINGGKLTLCRPTKIK